MKYFSFLIAALISISAVGQEGLLEQKGKNYHYKGKEYKWDKLGPVYRQSDEAYTLFKSGKKKKMQANIYALTGLGLIGSGALILLANDGDINLYMGGVVVLGLIFENMAIIFELWGNDKLKQALYKFNHEIIERNGYQSDSSLSFRVTGNRLVLVFQF